ncbi:MAG: hypothetical protein AB9834_08445 [Lentimicrobium sp.]
MNYRKILLFLLMAGYGYYAAAQVTGCADPQALNFDSLATVNDGSCMYPPTSIAPARVVRSLPAIVKETSGLIFWNQGLWTHNDSGGEPVLYKLDTLTGKVIQTITLLNAMNIDWEELAQDESAIYIGDFGNNLGNRRDLKIYSVLKKDIPSDITGEVKTSVINFSYADQLDYTPANRNNNYDCEAMVAFGDSLYLFSKNWADQQSRLYAIPKAAGSYRVAPTDNLLADGLITGADLSPSGKEMVLCGYENYSPFIWVLFDFREANFFQGNKRRLNFSAMTGTQTEGVTFLHDSSVVISSEKTPVSPSSLYKVDIKPWIKAN